MGTSTRRAARLATAVGASAVVIFLGAGPVAAQDQHSGGVSPNEEAVDTPTQLAVDESNVVLGQSQASGGGLPVTGSDVAGLAGIGAVAVAMGAGAVAVSRRRNHISA